MIRARENKRLGLLDPFVLKQAECIRRSWDLQLSKLVDIECNMKGAINSLSADYQNGIFLLSGCSDGSIFINNLCNFTGQPAYTCKEMTRIRKPDHPNASSRSVETVQWYPFDTGLFLSSGMDGILKLWDTNKLEVAEAFKFQGRIFQHHMSNVTSPSSSLVAVASSVNEVLLLDIRTGNRAHELRGHTSLVLSCQWSPRDWYCLATGSNDNSVMIWDIRSNKSCMSRSNQSGEMVKAKHGHAQTSHDGAVNSLTFTKSGLFLLSLGVDSHLRLWNVSTGLNEPVDYGSVPNTTRKPAQMAVSETASKEFVYVPSRGYVLVYSIHTGEKMKSLRGHFGPVNCCCFNPFSFHLYSGAKDGYLLCWRHELLEDDSEERKQSHLNKLYKLNVQGSMIYYPSDISDI